jgi:DMSO reductase anchor subunit
VVTESLVEGSDECLAGAAERVGEVGGLLTGIGVVCGARNLASPPRVDRSLSRQQYSLISNNSISTYFG